jgi:hypothetical protein
MQYGPLDQKEMFIRASMQCALLSEAAQAPSMATRGTGRVVRREKEERYADSY